MRSMISLVLRGTLLSAVAATAGAARPPVAAEYLDQPVQAAAYVAKVLVPAYQEALCRDPLPEEKAFWLAKRPLATMAEVRGDHRVAFRNVVARAYLVGGGRGNDEAELQYWADYGEHTLGRLPFCREIVEVGREYLAANDETFVDVVTRAYRFSANRDPAPAEIEYWRSQRPVYHELIEGKAASFRSDFAAHQDRYQTVIAAAFQAKHGRAALPAEVWAYLVRFNGLPKPPVFQEMLPLL